MTFDLQRILESKRALRRSLASRPVAEKLALLDELRERARAIRGAGAVRSTPALRESPSQYRVSPPRGLAAPEKKQGSETKQSIACKPVGARGTPGRQNCGLDVEAVAKRASLRHSGGG